jgi:hypothetical protein
MQPYYTLQTWVQILFQICQYVHVFIYVVFKQVISYFSVHGNYLNIGKTLTQIHSHAFYPVILEVVFEISIWKYSLMQFVFFFTNNHSNTQMKVLVLSYLFENTQIHRTKKCKRQIHKYTCIWTQFWHTNHVSIHSFYGSKVILKKRKNITTAVMERQSFSAIAQMPI